MQHGSLSSQLSPSTRVEGEPGFGEGTSSLCVLRNVMGLPQAQVD